VSWIVGILIFAAIVYISLNTLRTVGGDAPGSRGLPANRPLPPFAMPTAQSRSDDDANVAREADQGQRGHRPACTVRGPQILNVCQLAERGPVVLAFLATRSGRCVRQLDLLDRQRPAFPGVQFAAVGIRGGHGDLRRVVGEHRWSFPVGYDHDGAVANLYAVSVCPTVTFAYPGGIVMRTTLGLLDGAALHRTLRALVSGSRERGWRPPA
jgi:hypothetical protein